MEEEEVLNLASLILFTAYKYAASWTEDWKNEPGCSPGRAHDLKVPGCRSASTSLRPTNTML